MKNNNVVKTIEELSLDVTANDLQDEFNTSTNPNSMILHLSTGEKTVVKFLGPFMGIYRCYAPFKPYSLQIDVDKIANKDYQAIKEAEQILKNIRLDNSNRTVIPDMIKFIKENKVRWQKDTMVNVYWHGQIKVLILTRRLIDSILNAVTRSQSNILLSGFSAPEISITKRGKALQTIFEVQVGKSSNLSHKNINSILANGLIDIPTLITELNKCKTGAYYYKKATDYKMPDEFMRELFAEIVRIEEDNHLNHVEEHLVELPLDAFERRNNMREAIGSLEV